MKHLCWRAVVAMAAGLVVSGCSLLDVEHARREELRREFGSGQISQREYQQQLDQMEGAKAEAAAAEKKK
jgi:Leu/Phe-tRNA-protein transferase